MHRSLIGLLALALAALPAAALAAAPPGRFDFYVLALSWSPQYCAEHGAEGANRMQCSSPQPIVVHGLWLEDESGHHPLSCMPAARVPGRLIDRMLPLMPNERLIQHEWASHGTCSGLSMDDYLRTVRQAFARIVVPDPMLRPHAALPSGTKRIKAMFRDANTGLAGDMMTVICDGQGEWVKEIRICLDRSLAFRPCGAGLKDSCAGGEARLRPAQ
jgi:ribonuclease T2